MAINCLLFNFIFQNFNVTSFLSSLLVKRLCTLFRRTELSEGNKIVIYKHRGVRNTLDNWECIFSYKVTKSAFKDSFPFHTLKFITLKKKS